MPLNLKGSPGQRLLGVSPGRPNATSRANGRPKPASDAANAEPLLSFENLQTLVHTYTHTHIHTYTHTHTYTYTLTHTYIHTHTHTHTHTGKGLPIRGSGDQKG